MCFLTWAVVSIDFICNMLSHYLGKIGILDNVSL